MISSMAGRTLTLLMRQPSFGHIHIAEMADHKIGVWLPGTRLFDRPNGTGDSLCEALEDAAFTSRITGSEWFRFLNPGQPEEAE
jgi:hypothetical protein